MPFADNWIASVQAAHLAGRPIALLFDYDGTLTPIVAHPSLAVLPDSIRELLRHLANLERVSVGVISGRALKDVSEMLCIGGLYYAGSSGAEVDLKGTRIESPITRNAQQQLATAFAELQGVVGNFPGVWIEPKPVGFAVHYRAASAATASIFRDCFRWLMSRFRALRCLNVRAAYEVTPVEAWDKGTAVQFILAKLPVDVVPVYFGGSENDRPAMERVEGLGGPTIAVGEAAPLFARYRLESSAALQTDLVTLCDALSAVAPKGEPVSHR